MLRSLCLGRRVSVTCMVSQITASSMELFYGFEKETKWPFLRSIVAALKLFKESKTLRSRHEECLRTCVHV